ncbi:MAG: L,D-transpeptidase [Flavobacteriales bacterium]|nr:L,D-transpeptidase [Flavobacteriales bacterium]
MRGFGLSLLLICASANATDPERAPVHPHQGVVDLLMEFMEIRYAGHDFSGDLLYVSVHRQLMYHVRGGLLLHTYPIATASKGLGTKQDSYRTPTGLHRVCEKFGDGVPPYGILKDRIFTGELADPDFAGIDKDWITSRILWLDGLEPGHNRGGDRDSHDRFIYIHGTANERSIGTASSRGCIRMRNDDVIALYDALPVGALVVVLDN